MNYEAICYYWLNKETDQIVYLGYHKTADELGDYYTSSTKNPAFHDMWNKGELDRIVFFRGTVAQCVSLEHYMLSKMKAKNNPNMFNETNGGGIGCDLNLVDPSMKALASVVISGKYKKNLVASSKRDMVALAKKIVEKVKENEAAGHYQTAELYVGEIDNYPKIQIRMKQRHDHHVNVIADRMSNPVEARKELKPIILVVYKNGMKKLLDGNHTLRAAIKANWKTLPVIYIPSEEFNDSYMTMSFFGKQMNKKKGAKEGNSKEDVKKTILELKEEGIAFNSSEMRDILIDLYDGEFSTSSIVGLITAVRERYDLDRLNHKYNFYTYSKENLAAMVEEYMHANPGHGCISQAADKVIFSGIGGIVNSFRQKSKGSNWDNPKGKIFIHYSNIEDWRERAALDKAIRDCLKIAKLDWVKLEYLPCFLNPETDELFHEPLNDKIAA